MTNRDKGLSPATPALPAVSKDVATAAGVTRLVLHFDAAAAKRLKDAYPLQRALAVMSLSVAEMSPISGIGMVIARALVRGIDELFIKGESPPPTKPRKKKRRG